MNKSKSQKIMLIVALTLIVVAVLFISRSFLKNKFGIFASTNGTIYSIVNLNVSSTSTFSNTQLKNGVIELKNPTEYGHVAGWTSNRPVYGSIKYSVSNIKVKQGCKYMVRVKSCGENKEASCNGAWEESKQNTVFSYTLPTYVWYGVTIYPCSK